MNGALSEEVREIALLAADGIKALSADADDRTVALYVAALILLSCAAAEAGNGGSPAKLGASLRTAAGAMERSETWSDATTAITAAFAEERAKRRKH